MAEDQPLSPKEILDRILNGDPARQAVYKAVQNAFQVFAETATKEVKTLVENNTQGPDVKAEMAELEKAVIEMTIKAIKQGPLGQQKGGPNKTDSGTTS